VATTKVRKKIKSKYKLERQSADGFESCIDHVIQKPLLFAGFLSAMRI
jgi:hypothetical protein